MDKPRFFTKDRFYQIGLGLLALLALGILISRFVSEARLERLNQQQKQDHEAVVASLIEKQHKEIDAATEDALAVLATALSGFPAPKDGDPPERFYPALDALVRHERLGVALVASADNVIVASSNRHFEGKPLAYAIAPDLATADPRGLIRTEAGWIVVATLKGDDDSPAGIVAVLHNRPKD